MRQEPKKKGTIIWAIVIGLIMVLSVIGFTLDNTSNAPEKYNGIIITQAADGYYYAKLDKQQVRFTYNPSTVVSYDTDQSAIDALKNTPIVFLTFDPKEDKDLLTGIDLARFELTNDLSRYFNMVVVQATNLNTSSYNLPVVTCADATATQPVMEFKSGDSTRISKEGNCIILEALSGNDFVKLKDRVMYGMFDVIR